MNEISYEMTLKRLKIMREDYSKDSICYSALALDNAIKFVEIVSGCKEMINGDYGNKQKEYLSSIISSYDASTEYDSCNKYYRQVWLSGRDIESIKFALDMMSIFSTTEDKE